MKIKKPLTLIKPILIIIATVFLIGYVLPWAFVGGAFLLSKSPPKPEIKYGEFPFEVVFEINGKTKSVNDIYVCEYDGIGIGSNGKYLKWKGYLKSNQKEDIVLITDGNKEIICTIGSPKYYMGDIDDSLITKTTEPKLILLEHYANGVSSSSILSDELKEYYKINLISWKLSDPIVNNFQ